MKAVPSEGTPQLNQRATADGSNTVRTDEAGAGLPKIRASSAGDGGRGVQEARSFVKGSLEFMEVRCAFGQQAGAEFLQAITITARHGVGGELQEFTYFLEGALVPDLEDDDFPLLRRQVFQAAQGGLFCRRRVRLVFEPPPGLKLPRQATQEGAAMIESTVSDGPDQIVLRLGRPLGDAEQSRKDLVKNVLGFRRAETEGPAVEQQLGRVLLIKRRDGRLDWTPTFHVFEPADTASPGFVCRGGKILDEACPKAGGR